MGKADRRVVVVGAGAVGVCAAYFLARRGARVTVVDAGEVGSGCSYGNAGLISFGHLPIQRPGVVKQAMRWMLDADSPLYIRPRMDAGLVAWLWRFNRACGAGCLEENMKTLNALSAASAGLFEEIHERSGCAFHYARNGYMEVYLTKAAFERAREHAEISKRHGFGYEAILGRELHEREPALTEKTHGAIWYPHSATCNPFQFVRATAELARREGAEFVEREPVRRVETKDGRAMGVALEDGRKIEGDVVVLAAGAWTPGIARGLGIRIPMQPAKGYHRDVEMPHPALTVGCVFGEASMACTPMDGFLRLAGTLEFSGVNLEMRRNRLDMLSAGARRYLRDKACLEGETKSEWVGMRPCSPDGLPIVGWAERVSGVYIATGHAMLGLTQGPVTGKIVSECVLDGRAGCIEGVERMGVGRFG